MSLLQTQDTRWWPWASYKRGPKGDLSSIFLGHLHTLSDPWKLCWEQSTGETSTGETSTLT